MIPIRRDKILSDGRLQGRTAWNWLEESLLEFGGATRDTSHTVGWYQDPDTGERVTDECRRYSVAVRPKRVRRLRAILREACWVFRQKCIYLSLAGAVEFAAGTSDEER